MKRVISISLGLWILSINLLRIWPISKGEQYYRRLEEWYLLAAKGKWNEAGKVAIQLKESDISAFIESNRSEELKKKLNELTIKNPKNADDWMEMATVFYRLDRKDEAYKAINNAYKLDPIREDISKVYFTFQTSLLR